MRATIVIAVALMSAVGATEIAVAATERERASAGDVSATLIDYNDGSDDELWLTVERAGEIVWDDPVSPGGSNCRFCGFGGLGRSPSLRVADLDGDGEPEVALTVYTGGAHCCFLGQVLDRTVAGGYRVRERMFGNPPVRLRDLDHDRVPEFVTGDNRFAYRFTYYAASGWPLQVWGYARGRLVQQTRSYPKQLRKDAARWWRIYRRARGHGEVRGVFAAWAADSYMLGRRAKVRRELRRGVRRHWFDGETSFGIADPDADGPRYQRKLLRVLKRAGS